jgi:hypothetical protein
MEQVNSVTSDNRVYNGVASETSVVPCDVITACCVAMHGAEKTPLPLLLRRVYSVASCLLVGCLAMLCCVTQQWVDMSQYVGPRIESCSAQLIH